MMIKCGKTEFEVNSEDVVMYNGKTYQLLTREVGSGCDTSTPRIAIGKVKKMIKDGDMILVKKELSKMLKNTELEYYKFNV